MPGIKQGEIVWIRFPYSDMKEVKFRPALILSNDSYNKKYNDVLICAITSNLQKREYGVVIDKSNMMRGTIPIKSVIRADKILSVEKDMVNKSFAEIDSRTFSAVVKKIMNLISL